MKSKRNSRGASDNNMYIHVKAKTGARKEEVNKISADHFEVTVKEPAEMNLANKRILAIIKAVYPGMQVKIVNGHHSPSKLLSVEEQGE